MSCVCTYVCPSNFPATSSKLIPLQSFDSVPCDTLWQVLERFGVPPVFLATIHSFHEDMRAAIIVKGRCSDSLQLKIGFGRGVL